MVLKASHVFVAQSEVANYAQSAGDSPVELPRHTPLTTALHLLRNLFQDAGLDSARYGTREWNPLGEVIDAGAKVVLKPNWVLDKNKLPGGAMECLVTHTSVIEAVLHYVVKAQPKSIVVGDAPLQSCSFDNLRLNCGLDEMVARFNRLGYDTQIRDFRLTKMKTLYGDKVEADPSPDDYCLFDLGQCSWLAPITKPGTEFRVTNYDPHVLETHHNPKSHRFLVAREVMDADVVINLPKLKTHKKAGVTGALKNIVGINGFKEYLPHHRKGSSHAGGDCYQGGSRLKAFAEDSLDRANGSEGPFSRYLHTHLAGLALRLDRVFLKGDRNLEGAWYGNDTVWRTCLDLQRILHYGNGVGELSDTPQRKVITITDAIVAGDGDGPLAPSPVPLGTMTLGANVAALEWVHCLLMRLDPERIPLVSHAFAGNDRPLADFSPRDIQVQINGEIVPDWASLAKLGRRFTPPIGWKGHCEITV